MIVTKSDSAFNEVTGKPALVELTYWYHLECKSEIMITAWWAKPPSSYVHRIMSCTNTHTY